jgi:hypothetical protein
MRASDRRGIWLTGAVATALVGWGLASAGASETLDSFAGSCSLQGTITFNPAVTNTHKSLTTTYDATGTCSGTLDGRQAANASVKMHNVGHSDGSCSDAHTTAPGQGSITFADGTAIRYAFDYTSVLTEIDLTMHGQRSGSATAHATSLTARTPPDVALQCSGSGASEIPLDLSLTTDSPLISGQPAGSGTPPSRPGSGDAPGTNAPVANAPLRLSVQPRSVRAGRRTTFAFRVATADGRSVSGAMVLFARRRARTGPTGVARIAATLHRPGPTAARATKPGFPVVRATIRVRRR